MAKGKKIAEAVSLSILAGATGAALALLLAPQSGRRTRRDLRKFKDNVLDRMSDFQEDVRDRVVELVDDFEAQIQRTRSKAGDEWLRPLYASKEVLGEQIDRAEKFLQRRREEFLN